MVRLTRWVALATLALLQVFVITASGYLLSGDALTGESGTSAAPEPTPEPLPVVTAGPVLATTGNGSLPAKSTLAAKLKKALRDPALGDSLGVSVIDVPTGTVLFGRGEHDGKTPASTTKVVTGVVALASLGPDAKISTRVVRGAGRNEIVLVGGGDPTLASPAADKRESYPRPASLATLAARTARALKAAKTTSVTLSYDDRLYTGPATGPGWKPGYVPEGSVAPVSALAVDGGRVSPDTRQRVPEPARIAAELFGELLGKHGIKVSGRVGRAAGTGTELARVDSPPVYALVERMLTMSDNDLAEALVRQVALKENRPASFTGGAQAVRTVLRRLGVAEGIEVYDGSGLSTRNRITAQGMARLLAFAAAPERSHLHAAISGLAVAGFTGTLGHRYDTKEDRAGAGMIRGKTGTLNGVNTLAGVVRTDYGRLLAFALLADRTPPPWDRSEAALDRIATLVMQCCAP